MDPGTSRRALDADWLGKQLPRHLWLEGEKPPEIQALHISQVREGPKRTTAVYDLTLRTPDGEVLEQSYVGYVPHDPDRLMPDYQAIAARAVIQPRVGRSVAMLPEANLVFVACPNDRSMDLLSEAELRRWAKKLVPALFRPRRVEEARTTLLRYVPSRRVTTRCWLKFVARDGTEREWSCIAKQHGDKGKARALYRNLQALESAWPGDCLAGGSPAVAGRDGQFALRVPRALAFDQGKGIVFIEECGGKDLSTALSEVDLETVMPAVGRLLATLHLAPERVRDHASKRVSRTNELEETRAALRDIDEGLPGLSDRARKLLEMLRRARAGARTRTVLLHGSFRLNHVFIDDEALTLLDLEGLRKGDPAYDIANCLSALYYAEAEQRLDAATRRGITRDLLRGYTAAVPWSLDPDMLLWFLATLLINKQAHKYLRHHHADRHEKVQRMLALAEEVLAIAVALPGERQAEALWKVIP